MLFFFLNDYLKIFLEDYFFKNGLEIFLLENNFKMI